MAVGVGARVILVSPTGDRMEYTIRLHFQADNVGEYEALIHGLRIASDFDAHHDLVRGDSELVICQVMKEASCHDSKMVAYCDEVWKLKETFDGLELHHVLIRDNLAIDSLAKIVSSQGPAPPGVIVNDAHEPLVRTNQLHTQATSVADKDGLAKESKADPGQLIQHHINLGATCLPNLMAIDQEAASTNSD